MTICLSTLSTILYNVLETILAYFPRYSFSLFEAIWPIHMLISGWSKARVKERILTRPGHEGRSLKPHPRRGAWQSPNPSPPPSLS